MRLTEAQEANLTGKRQTSNFKLFVGDDYSFELNNEEEKEEVIVVDEVAEIKVMLNGERIHLNNKKRYAVIDALDAANIDAMQAAGKDIIITVNGRKATFSTEIDEADKVEFSFS